MLLTTLEHIRCIIEVNADIAQKSCLVHGKPTRTSKKQRSSLTFFQSVHVYSWCIIVKRTSAIKIFSKRKTSTLFGRLGRIGHGEEKDTIEKSGKHDRLGQARAE